MGALVLLTIAIMFFLPKITKKLPAALTAIVIVSALVIGFGLDTKTVGDVASVGGGLPTFSIPMVPFTLETLYIIFPYSLILAGIGLLESLLTLTIVDQLTDTRGRGNQESIAQGAANVIGGFFGTMGGCAMIGQSIINVSSGGRTRLSGITAAVMLLVFILFLSTFIEMVPMAALVGLMFMVAIGTFEWASFKVLRRIPKSDALVMVAVTVLTVIFDLAIAVLIGVIIAALVFAWDSAVRIRARKRVDENGVKHYKIYGPLFFGSTATFLEKFDVTNDPEEVVIDFKESRVVDHSGIETLNKLTGKYQAAGKKLHLRHLSEDCRRLLANAESFVEVNIMEDPHYAVLSDKLS